MDVKEIHELTHNKPRGTLKSLCEKEGLDFNATKQKLYRYRIKLGEPKSVQILHESPRAPRKPKPKKPKFLTMDDIHKWLLANKDNVITQRMMMPRKHGRSAWKDQYSKFADLLSIVNSIKS